MVIVFLAAAKAELDEAIEHYDHERKGLGQEFASEVTRTIGRILAAPLAWPKASKRTRRCLVKRFPYGILYQVQRDEIRIVAVMHLHRRPGYWKKRLK